MRSFLSLFTKLSFHTAPVVRALRTSARIERISERVLVFQAREARFVPYKRAFSSVYVLLLHIERMRLLKTTTTTTPYVLRIYTKRAQETLRDFEEAKKQSALKRARFLNCSLVVFVFFVLCFIMLVVSLSLVCCCCRSHLSLRSTTTTPYVLHLCSVARILQS